MMLLIIAGIEERFPNLEISIAIKTCDTPVSTLFLLISLVDDPPDNTVAKISSSNDKPAPFQ